MANLLGGAPAPRRLVLGAYLTVAALCAAAVALAHALEPWAAGSGVTGTAGFGRWVVLLLATASGLFVAAGVLRLVSWRLERRSHGALVGMALVLMGGACLPLGGFARLFASPEHAPVVSLTTRAVGSLIVMALLVRALTAGEGPGRARPSRLLPVLLGLVVATFLLVLAVSHLVPQQVVLLRPALAGMLALGWCAVALRTDRQRPVSPWAGRAAPLFVGMASAEVLRALDRGRIDSWTLSSVLVCAGVATLALRSALVDLDEVVSTDEDHRSRLSAALDRASGTADELAGWREQLTHDARNACAGLRAAMDVLERYAGRVDPATTERLRLAAVEEIGHLEHLLDRAADQPCERFDVTQVVRTVAESARTLGSDVTVIGECAEAVGRPGDVAAVLRNVLVNARTHAAGSSVEIRVAVHAGVVRVVCCDDGPGISPEIADHAFERGIRGGTSPGSGLGLYGARALMREQGGDLELGSPAPGATLVLSLPAASAPSVQPVLRLVPAQRRPAEAAPDAEMRQEAWS